VIAGFDMPVRVTLSDNTFALIHPTEAPQKAGLQLRDPASFAVDPNFYVIAHRTGTPQDTTVKGQSR
jgi:hypothetical protein